MRHNRTIRMETRERKKNREPSAKIELQGYQAHKEVLCGEQFIKLLFPDSFIPTMVVTPGFICRILFFSPNEQKLVTVMLSIFTMCSSICDVIES